MNEVVFEQLLNLWQQRKSEFVFPSPSKTRERFRDPKVGFMKAVRLPKIPDLRFHGLRHTFATRLVRASVDLVTVHHLLGHRTTNTTTRYAHSFADDKMAAVRRLDFAGVH
jgi:integrase